MLGIETFAFVFVFAMFGIDMSIPLVALTRNVASIPRAHLAVFARNLFRKQPSMRAVATPVV